jgi:hypothetical protein
MRATIVMPFSLRVGAFRSRESSMVLRFETGRAPTSHSPLDAQPRSEDSLRAREGLMLTRRNILIGAATDNPVRLYAF